MAQLIIGIWEEVRLFHIKKKKVFKSRQLNRLTMAEHLVWLIPIGFMLRDIIITWDQVEEVLADNPTGNYCGNDRHAGTCGAYTRIVLGDAF